MNDIDVWKVDFQSHEYTAQKISISPQPASLNDVINHIPGGAYTTFRTYNHDKVLHLEDHFNRLEETAHIVLNKDFIIDRCHLRMAIRQAVDEFPSLDTRIRIILNLENNTGKTLYIALEKLTPPANKDYLHGVHVVTHQFKREMPKAKRTDFIQTTSEIKKLLPKNVNEVLILDDNRYILEGMSSNFFAIVDGDIFTDEEHVLSGITRSIVLEIAKNTDVSVHFRPVSVDDLNKLDEAFITSSSRGILPVTQIDDHVIGTGKPGKTTIELYNRYQQKIAHEISDI